MTAVDHLRQEQFAAGNTYRVPIGMVDNMESGDFPGKSMRSLMRLPADERRGYRTDKQDEREFVHHRYAAAKKAGLTHLTLKPFYPEEGPYQ